MSTTKKRAQSDPVVAGLIELFDAVLGEAGDVYAKLRALSALNRQFNEWCYATAAALRDERETLLDEARQIERDADDKRREDRAQRRKDACSSDGTTPTRPSRRSTN